MSEPKMPPHVAAMLAMFSAAGISGIEAIHIPAGTTDIDAFVDEFIEQKRAEHRQVCQECADAYAAESKAAADKVAAVPRDVASGNVEPGTTSAPKATRAPLGYMVFATKDGIMQPVPNSFAVTREAVEAKVAKFDEQPLVQSILELMAKHGQKKSYEIRPVYGD